MPTSGVLQNSDTQPGQRRGSRLLPKEVGAWAQDVSGMNLIVVRDVVVLLLHVLQESPVSRVTVSVATQRSGNFSKTERADV